MTMNNHSARFVRRGSRALSLATYGRFSAVEQLEARAYMTIAFDAAVTTALIRPAGTFEKPLVGDFNNDGKNDVIVVVESSAQEGPAGFLYYMQGNGDGTLQAPVQVASPIFNQDALAGDFNGDGNLDLVVADFGADKLHVFTGNGDGTFNASADFSTGDGPFNMAAGDFNGDGKADIVAGNRQGNSLTVRLGDADHTLGSATSIAVGTDPSGVVVGDFNGDGKLDIVAGNTATGTESLSFIAGNGAGGFAAAVTTSGTLPGSAISSGADFNNDGKLDLLHGFDSATGDVDISFGNGDGTFGSPTATGSLVVASTGDFDGDGKVDVLYDGTNANHQSIVRPGNGDGSFGDIVGLDIGTDGLGTSGDLNGDGLPDAVFATLPDDTTATLVTLLANPTAPNLTAEALGTLPAAVVGGAKGGKLSVRVTNSGNEAFAGPVTVQLMASADQTADSGDTVIVSQTPTLKLKPGKAKTLKFKFNYPSTLADGAYFVLAQIDPAGTAAEAPKTDNVAVGPQVTIAAPFIDLSTAITSPLASSYGAGKKGKVTLDLDNLGNILASGTATATLTISTDATLDVGDTAVVVATKVKIKPGTTKRLKLSALVPATLAAGSYDLFVTLTPTSFADSNLANNTVLASGAFVVS